MSDTTMERVSPLHRRHVAAGAVFTDFAGWQMPVRYSSDLAEHHAVRNDAAVFDLSHMGEILVLGPEAPDALDYALSGTLSTIPEGRAKYSLMLGRDGGIIDDLVVYRTGQDRYLVVANASNREVVAAELIDRCAPFDCEVQDESEDIALLAVQGPRALELLLEIGEIFVDDLADLGYYRSAKGEFGTHALLVARTGYTGENGYELYLAPEAAPDLWDALLETGAGSGVLPAGLAARDTLRLEAGMPLYGHELGTGILPVQAGLGRAVDLTKDGDFVGRAAVEAELDASARVLVGLTLEGRRAGRAGYPVRGADGDGVVGEVTSGALSPTLGYPIAMAFVDRGVSALDTSLIVDVRGTQVPATVVPLPFYKRDTN